MNSNQNALFALAFALPALFATPAVAAAPRNAVPQVALAPLDTAHTFAQVSQNDRLHTLFVLKISGTDVVAINLSELSGLHGPDALDVIKHFDATKLDSMAREPGRTQRYALADLAGVGPRGLDQIAAGTNYPAHGEEVGMADAFLFPKKSPAIGPRSALSVAPGTMMDYEVEICARFDRELRSDADFDAARKAFFLCGDYSDRASLIRNLNLKNVFSGDGFADAKSGFDRFPVGPLLVIPRDWKAFLKEVEIETHVDGKRRQHAYARDMIKDLRVIVQETLAESGTRTWSYQGGRIPMVSRAAIGTDSAILTGTGDGVVFNKPDAATMKSVMTAKDRSGQLAAIDRYIAGEVDKRIYLQPGNTVIYTGKYLGSIHTTVVAAKR
jgi:2-keto-4-pentenoate hydratase/2-oxohepta-3-ene-1,7-dioic acid hydratase in catechol pathway